MTNTKQQQQQKNASENFGLSVQGHLLPEQMFGESVVKKTNKLFAFLVLL